MKEKFPEIFKNKIDNVKSKIQKEYYYRNDINEEVSDAFISKSELLMKINNIFKNKDFIYQADINIIYKNNEIIRKKIIGIKENYLITLDNEKISIDDIKDIK